MYYQSFLHEYFKIQPAYQNLVDEISFLLEKKAKDAGIEISHVAKRVKSSESVSEKIRRKKYDNPLKQITDLAGVRLVYLYLDDFEKIEKIIREAFIVVEKVDKSHEEPDRFGYLANHFIVKVRKPVVGERYSLLKGLKCEIQVRTVVQDSWAILSHHLIYKSKKEIPKRLVRKIHSLAAVLENSDLQFNQIEEERRGYLAKLYDPAVSLSDLKKEESNKDSIIAFLRRKYPDMELESYERHQEAVLRNIDFNKYNTLGAIDNILEDTKEIRSSYQRDDDFQGSSLAQLALAIGCIDSDYRRTTVFGKSAYSLFETFDDVDR